MRILSLRVTRDICFKVKELERPKTTVTRNLMHVHPLTVVRAASTVSKGIIPQLYGSHVIF
jgi:hypothetical protein